MHLFNKRIKHEPQYSFILSVCKKDMTNVLAQPYGNTGHYETFLDSTTFCLVNASDNTQWKSMENISHNILQNRFYFERALALFMASGINSLNLDNSFYKDMIM